MTQYGMGPPHKSGEYRSAKTCSLHHRVLTFILGTNPFFILNEQFDTCSRKEHSSWKVRDILTADHRPLWCSSVNIRKLKSIPVLTCCPLLKFLVCSFRTKSCCLDPTCCGRVAVVLLQTTAERSRRRKPNFQLFVVNCLFGNF